MILQVSQRIGRGQIHASAHCAKHAGFLQMRHRHKLASGAPQLMPAFPLHVISLAPELSLIAALSAYESKLGPALYHHTQRASPAANVPDSAHASCRCTISRTRLWCCATPARAPSMSCAWSWSLPSCRRRGNGRVPSALRRRPSRPGAKAAQLGELSHCTLQSPHRFPLQVCKPS